MHSKQRFITQVITPENPNTTVPLLSCHITSNRKLFNKDTGVLYIHIKFLDPMWGLQDMDLAAWYGIHSIEWFWQWKRICFYDGAKFLKAFHN